jgi:nucleoside-diphosphate-sugar epimerase
MVESPEPLKNAPVLITGGTGFLGQRLVRCLLARGAEVRCLVRSTSNLAPLQQAARENQSGHLKIFRGNLGRVDSYAAALEGSPLIYHLAASLSGATAVLFMDNVIATRRLLERLGRTPIARFVLVSSLAVYGTNRLRAAEELDETCPLDPEPHRRDPYTFSKVAQERVAWESHGATGLPLVVVRPGVIYGPGRECLTTRVGLKLGNLLVRMGGGGALPYTYVDNCAEALALAGTTPGIEGQAFNIVDDSPPTGRELVRQYRRQVRRLRVLPVYQFAIGPLSRLCEGYARWSQGQFPAILTPYKSQAQWKPLRYNNAKAKDLLGWRPRVAFRDGLEQTFAWLREQNGAAQTAAGAL